MTDTQIIFMLITTNACSAAIAALVVWSYWRDIHNDTLRSIAADRASEQAEIRNARMVNRTFAGMRGIDVANIGEDSTP